MHFLLISFPWTPTLKCKKCISDPLLIVLHIKSNSNWKIQFSVFNICEFDQLLFSGWIWTIFCVNHCLTRRHSDHKSPIFTNGPIQCWPPYCFRLFTFNMQDKNNLENTYCYKKNIVCIVKKCLLNIPGLEILSSVDNEGRKYLKIDLLWYCQIGVR